MKVIWKFSLNNEDTNHIEMPRGASILTVATDYLGEPQIWALVNPDREKEERKFITYGTGHTINNPHTLEFIGTFQLKHMGLVWHVFEENQS